MKFDNPHAEFCFKNASHFTAVRGLRPQSRTRVEFKTFEDACAYAAEIGDKRTMIYAVTTDGRDAHICNA